MGRDELGLSERRACRLVGIHRSVARYVPRKGDVPKQVLGDWEKDIPKLVLGDWEKDIPRLETGSISVAGGLLITPKQVYRAISPGGAADATEKAKRHPPNPRK